MKSMKKFDASQATEAAEMVPDNLCYTVVGFFDVDS
jgi:hypothetical protein